MYKGCGYGREGKCRPESFFNTVCFIQLSVSWNCSTGFKQVEKVNVAAARPQRNVLKSFAIFESFAHGLGPGGTPNYSASRQTPNYVQRS